MSESIPDLVVSLDRATLMAYGGATWDWHCVHYDSDAAKARGLKGPIADGQMFGALIARQIRKWAGPRGRFIELEYRNRLFVLAPNTVTITSEIASSQDNGAWKRVEVKASVRDQDGNVVVESARIVVEVPR